MVVGDWNADGFPDLAVPLFGLPSIQLMPGDGAAPNSIGYLVGSAPLNPTPLFGGTLVPVSIQLLIPVITDSAGSSQLGPVIGQSLPFSYYARAGLVDPTLPGGIAVSNALMLDSLP